jgi:RimJ/RimL family protein N-acetyltransferase
MVPTGETKRLILRPLEIGDATQIQEMFPQWEIVRYLQKIVPWPYPENGALEFIRDVALPLMSRDEAWNWTLRLKSEPGQVIGNIHLRRGERDHRGFWLGLAWHGQGLMSEACAWTSDFWFETLRFPVLRVSKAAANRESSRISEKQGMRLVGVEEKDYVCGTLRSEIWEITAEEWRAWKSSRQLN